MAANTHRCASKLLPVRWVFAAMLDPPCLSTVKAIFFRDARTLSTYHLRKHFKAFLKHPSTVRPVLRPRRSLDARASAPVPVWDIFRRVTQTCRLERMTLACHRRIGLMRDWPPVLSRPLETTNGAPYRARRVDAKGGQTDRFAVGRYGPLGSPGFALLSPGRVGLVRPLDPRYRLRAGRNSGGLCGRATHQGITRPTVRRWRRVPCLRE